MTEKIILLALWALAIGGVVFAFLNQREPGRSSVARPPTIGGWRSVVGIIGAALFMLLLTGCTSTPVINAPSSSCTTLIPKEWRDGVAGAPLPDGDTAGDWIAFADAQTGKLDQANGRTKDTIGIVERCEARDREAVKRAGRGWLGRLFGG